MTDQELEPEYEQPEEDTWMPDEDDDSWFPDEEPADE